MLVLVFQIFVIRAQGSSCWWLLSWIKFSVSAFLTVLITCVCLCFKYLWSGRKEAVNGDLLVGSNFLFQLFLTIQITCLCLCFESLWSGRKEAGGSICNDGSGRWWASGVTQSFIVQSPTIYHQNQSTTRQDHQETFPKAQRTHGIVYSDTFNTFSSKQKLQKNFEILVLVLFGKKREMHRTTLKKSM